MTLQCKLKLKPKPCSWCGTEYIRWSSTQNTCSPDCALAKLKHKQETQLKRDIRASDKIKRSEHRKAKEKLKSRGDREREAQDAANKYTREIDKGNNCISCGKSEAELKIKSPIAMVCGHYLSVGAYPELRYHDFNRNLQCTRCNGGAGKYGQFNSKALTVTKQYRENLIKKIGLSNVEWLEGPHKSQNRTVDDLIEIKQYYKEQLKFLKQ